MNTKRMPVALLVLAAIVTVVVPGGMYAQKGKSSPVAPRRELVASVVQEAYDQYKN
jgi:hypothetical protein